MLAALVHPQMHGRAPQAGDRVSRSIAPNELVDPISCTVCCIPQTAQ